MHHDMKTVFFPLPLLLLITACSPKVSETTRITGRVEGGTADRAGVYMMDGNLNERIELKDNGFSYELPTNKAVVATFTCRIDGQEVNLAVIPDGSELTLTFRPEGSNLRSSNRKSLNYKMQEIEQVYAEMRRLSSKQMALQQAGAPREQIDSVAALARPVFESLQELHRKNIDEQKDNFLGAYGVSYLQGLYSDEQLDSLIRTLEPGVVETARMQMILRDVQARLRTREGMPFADFHVETENGTVSLSDFVGKGKYVIADFWASWCQPCIAEMPYLKEVYKKYNGSNVLLLGITNYEKPEVSRAAAQELGLPWDQIYCPNLEAMETYGISGIPHIILFGPDGTILRRHLHGAHVGEILEEYL